jgi:hypothetical protein
MSSERAAAESTEQKSIVCFLCGPVSSAIQRKGLQCWGCPKTRSGRMLLPISQQDTCNIVEILCSFWSDRVQWPHLYSQSTCLGSRPKTRKFCSVLLSSVEVIDQGRLCPHHILLILLGITKLLLLKHTPTAKSSPFSARSHSRENRLLAASFLCSGPSVLMFQRYSHLLDFRKIWYLRLLYKSIEKLQVWLKLDTNNGHMT